MRTLVASLLLWAGTGTAGEAAHPLLLLSLDDSPRMLSALTGSRPGITDGPTYRVMAFEHKHAGCEGSPEWQIFLDTKQKSALSVTWRPEAAVPSSTLFPAPRLFTQNGARYLVRDLGQGRVLFAPSVLGQTTLSEVTLMRAAALPRFLPWLAKALENAKLEE